MLTDAVICVVFCCIFHLSKTSSHQSILSFTDMGSSCIRTFPFMPGIKTFFSINIQQTCRNRKHIFAFLFRRQKFNTKGIHTTDMTGAELRVTLKGLLLTKTGEHWGYGSLKETPHKTRDQQRCAETHR